MFQPALSKTGGKNGGQYYTPKNIVSDIIAMLEPYSGKIYKY
ncbi:MAG: SAM-dependent methyltransferase [Puniceicoccales bacterium]|nr:SAM-dependent methyltransferase [Puniceicoccales bacterium]